MIPEQLVIRTATQVLLALEQQELLELLPLQALVQVLVPELALEPVLVQVLVQLLQRSLQ
jgi:hypothetical protein